MERNFIKREPEKSAINEYSALSPFVKNLIYGAEVPKPCRYFCDRDREQSELHFMLNEYGKLCAAFTGMYDFASPHDQRACRRRNKALSS